MASGSTSRVSIRLARLNFAAGTFSASCSKRYMRRQSAIQLLGSREPWPRKPLVPEKSNSSGSVPSPLSKARFQLYFARIMLCPSRNAATENSTGIVGTSVGSAPASKNLRPLAKTSSTTAGSQIRGR